MKRTRHFACWLASSEELAQDGHGVKRAAQRNSDFPYWLAARSRVLCALVVVPSLLFQSPLSQGSFTILDNVNLVLLDVSVKDLRTGFVAGLDKANFRVLEDGKPRPITQFGSIDAPVTVGLVVDNSGSMRSKRAEVVQAGLAFSRASNPNDEFFVVNFNDSVVSSLPANVPFTDDLQILRHALYYGNPNGQTALYDAVSYSLRHLEVSHRELRTLIIVSDGGDNVSKVALAELLNQIESSRATIYAIGLLDPENRDLKPAVLRKFAAISGGEYFQPRSLDDVRPVFERISKDIRNRYTIGFVPDDRDRRDIRTVKVRAQRDGKRFAVRTRTTYRIPASASGHA
jgi:VWFA-related protein